ncbi:hypothetical protein AND_001790 [Anopheles darlingi]|uniref:Kinesin motor domain-containing protein n=1 Tax=Anopheles darlingi TaxID=43151 RepID=W5JUL0_ANODA|nr:hypothetical protein AND_001790 [Anopheles darlingi]
MAQIEQGTIVNIMRSDGRIHSAMVSCVHPDSRSVTVEWYERGETKGKEMDLDMLLELNREALMANEEAPIRVTNVDRGQTDERPVTEDRPQGLRESRIPPPKMNPVNHINNNEERQKAAAAAAAALVMVPAIKTEASGVISSDADWQSNRDLANPTQAVIRFQNLKASRQTVVAGAGAPPSTAAAGIVPPPSTASAAVAAAPSTAAAMEENRARQRDKFKVMREKKNALMNQDGGNPNWEFANMIREFQSTIEFRPLADDQQVPCLPITVCVRKRPLSKKEKTRKDIDVICVPNSETLLVHEPKTKVDLTKYLENQKYRFDYVFDETCSNETVYNYSAKPLVQSVVDGGMATCFAYGQTASGKTHTMAGTFTGRPGQQNCQNGIYALAANDMFDLLQSPQYADYNFIVTASFYEIYSGKINGSSGFSRTAKNRCSLSD